jgi:hypothetical protein
MDPTAAELNRIHHLPNSGTSGVGFPRGEMGRSTAEPTGLERVVVDVELGG